MPVILHTWTPLCLPSSQRDGEAFKTKHLNIWVGVLIVGKLHGLQLNGSFPKEGASKQTPKKL